MNNQDPRIKTCEEPYIYIYISFKKKKKKPIHNNIHD